MTSPAQSLDLFRFLARLIGDATLRAEERARATHGRFNVFTTLLSPDDEERLHTRFLHALLNPAGLHDCGPLFLNLFLETLREVPPIGPDERPIAIDSFPQDWHVYKEASRPPHGSIDLFLERKGTGIAIENKIFAREQPRQLARYAEYLAGRFPDEDKRFLLYLTRFGEAATTCEDKPYFQISYRDHILHWLEKCLRETYAFLPINQALLQYRAVVRQVIELPNAPEIMEEATDFVKKNPDILRFRNVINEAAEAVHLRFLTDIYEGVAAEMRDVYDVVPPADLSRLGKEEDTNFHVIPKDSSHPIHSAKFHLTLEYWAREGRSRYAYGQWIFGLDLGHEITVAEQPFFEKMRAFLIANDCGEDYEEPIKNAPAWPLGWWCLIPDLTDVLLATELENRNLSDPKRLRDEIEKRISLLASAYIYANEEFPQLNA